MALITLGALGIAAYCVWFLKKSSQEVGRDTIKSMYDFTGQVLSEQRDAQKELRKSLTASMQDSSKIVAEFALNALEVIKSENAVDKAQADTIRANAEINIKILQDELDKARFQNNLMPGAISSDEANEIFAQDGERKAHLVEIMPGDTF